MVAPWWVSGIRAADEGSGEKGLGGHSEDPPPPLGELHSKLWPCANPSLTQSVCRALETADADPAWGLRPATAPPPQRLPLFQQWG